MYIKLDKYKNKKKRLKLFASVYFEAPGAGAALDPAAPDEVAPAPLVERAPLGVVATTAAQNVAAVYVRGGPVAAPTPGT